MKQLEGRFSEEEFTKVFNIARNFVQREYLTGFNFLQSRKKLPTASILVHYFHDSLSHIRRIKNLVSSESLSVPRHTCYLMQPSYVTKPNFKLEYKNARFFRIDQEISIDEVLENPQNISVWNKECDLIFPLEGESSLLDTLEKLLSAMEAGIRTWIDPAIIIKGAQSPLDGFVPRDSVRLAKGREEFYAILHNESQKEFLIKELDKLCSIDKIGRLERHDITFPLSHINTEFARYLSLLQF